MNCNVMSIFIGQFGGNKRAYKKCFTYLNDSFVEVHTPSDDLKILNIFPILTVWLYRHSLQPILVRHWATQLGWVVILAWWEWEKPHDSRNRLTVGCRPHVSNPDNYSCW